MSIYSGKCDLFDHIQMCKHHETDHGWVSDELEAFEEFKKRTGGVIYQYTKVEVNKDNVDFVKKHCACFESSDGKYTYYGVDYPTLKKLNKHGAYISREIHFDSLLDIIPYYPYIVSFCYSYEGKETVYISNHSYLDTLRNIYVTMGLEPVAVDAMEKQLQRHYEEVVDKYYNKTGRSVAEEIKGAGQITLRYPIDTFFKVTVDHDGPIWSEPKIIDADKGVIDMSGVWTKEPPETAVVRYIRKKNEN